MSNFSRRKFISIAGVTAAGTLFTHGCSSKVKSSSGGGDSASTTAAVSMSAADAPEVTTATLGFIALTDSAPLIIAKEKGLFAKYGMKDVKVVKQTSWAATRDNLVTGSQGGGIDGAHILSPMPYLMTTGKITDGKPVPMYILARLNLDGQCISVSSSYKDLKIDVKGGGALKDAFAKAKASGKETKCAVTFPGGTHDLWMRYWLSAGGIDPTKDAKLIVIPPPQMVSNMKEGQMEAFCVGEPWNGQLVNQGIGYTALTTGELWNKHPEKAFTMRQDWVDKNPKAAKALLMAIMEAQMWCDKMENKDEMAEICSAQKYFKAPAKDIVDRAKGKFDYGTGRVEENSPHLMKFWRDAASYPFQSHDLWFLTEEKRWGYLPADLDAKALIKKVNREDIWREAAKALKVPEAEIPKSTSRGVETFFDGVTFDPEKPEEYLKSLKITASA
jgi:nitrate/nitrite transport system substrate-binding protein